MICKAGIAQLVEQLLRKQLVGGSSPLSGTIFPANFLALLNRLPFKIVLILPQCNPGATFLLKHQSSTLRSLTPGP